MSSYDKLYIAISSFRLGLSNALRFFEHLALAFDGACSSRLVSGTSCCVRTVSE